VYRFLLVRADSDMYPPGSRRRATHVGLLPCACASPEWGRWEPWPIRASTVARDQFSTLTQVRASGLSDLAGFTAHYRRVLPTRPEHIMVLRDVTRACPNGDLRAIDRRPRSLRRPNSSSVAATETGRPIEAACDGGARTSIGSFSLAGKRPRPAAAARRADPIVGSTSGWEKKQARDG
jgi:hypothetical protein